MEVMRAHFSAGCADDSAALSAIGRVWDAFGYLMDTHTAVAWKVAEGYESDAPVVVLSTASPYKFPTAVLSAIGGDVRGDEFEIMDRLHDLTGVPVPQVLATLRTKEVRHKDVIDRDKMLDYVLGKAAQKQWF